MPTTTTTTTTYKFSADRRRPTDHRARSAAKKTLGPPVVRSEFRYFGGAFAALFPISGPRVEI
jgi:hypothetical protein